MQKTTSFHQEPVKPSSESHNQRLKILDYVDNSLTPQNESYIESNISSRMKEISNLYNEKVHQKMQATTKPIREGVVVINEKTTLEQLKDVAKRFEQEFNCHVFQIYIHRDEGKKIKGKWKANYHAHLLIDWQNKKTGRMIKPNKEDLSLMQDICAECLNMERGKSSTKKHLNAIEYKIQQETKRAEELSLSNKTKETTIKAIEAIEDKLGINEKKKEIKSLKSENTSLHKDLSNMIELNNNLKEEIAQIRRDSSYQIHKLQQENEILAKRKKITDQAIKFLLSVFKPKTRLVALEYLKKAFKLEFLEIENETKKEIKKEQSTKEENTPKIKPRGFNL